MKCYAHEAAIVRVTCSCKKHKYGRCAQPLSQKRVVLTERCDGSFGFGVKTDKEALKKFERFKETQESV